MIRPCLPVLASLLIVFTLPAQQPADPGDTWKEEDSIDDRWNHADIGPFLASVLHTPAGPIAKGFSVRLGDPAQTAVGYDLQTGSLRVAWSGKFLSFDARRYGIVSAPRIAGTVRFLCSGPCWGNAPVRYRGMYQHGRRVVLSYQVADASVLESPGAANREGSLTINRTLEIGPHKQPLSLILLDRVSKTSLEKNSARGTWKGNTTQVVVLAPGIQPRLDGNAIVLDLPPSDKRLRLKVCYCPAGEELTTAQLQASELPAENLQALSRPGKPLWPAQLSTPGILGSEEGPYQVDTIPVPFDNPYKALMFIAGHDFFSNGVLVACTMHGDIWTVSGIDKQLRKVRWRRFATGFHQSMGVRIVDDRLYILGKDQITRLEDRDGDGEADWYENFNNDGQTSLGGHDFASCLETDPDGNFYYIRAKEGVVRVSADGTKHESIATGFRNPVGLGVGPQGVVTAAPQEGTWTPKSCIIEVRQGGFYGFGGPRVTPQRPLGYDPPLCWMPRLQDNSSGGQVWVTSDRWGPFQGQMLHLSYGQCALLVVMREEIGEHSQGGTVKLPYLFKSGVMRGRFNPRDGQLYLTGLKGWQTLAADDGCLQRVRYTGKPVNLPKDLKVTSTGVTITFTDPLDRETAGDPDNYVVDWWNYRYSEQYGSKEYRVSNPRMPGREEVFIDAARLLPDGRTVVLELEEIQPVMQMQISFSIRSAAGVPIKQTIYNTINVVPGGK
jgi:hypothetical protein